MKRRLVALALIASLGIGTHTFAQDRHPQQPPRQVERKDNRPAEVRYYYIPAYNAYFDAINKIYFYQKNNRWIETKRPARINRNIGQATREPLNDIKGNEKPYDHNSQHMQTWKGQQPQRQQQPQGRR